MNSEGRQGAPNTGDNPRGKQSRPLVILILTLFFSLIAPAPPALADWDNYSTWDSIENNGAWITDETNISITNYNRATSASKSRAWHPLNLNVTGDFELFFSMNFSWIVYNPSCFMGYQMGPGEGWDVFGHYAGVVLATSGGSGNYMQAATRLDDDTKITGPTVARGNGNFYYIVLNRTGNQVDAYFYNDAARSILIGVSTVSQGAQIGEYSHIVFSCLTDGGNGQGNVTLGAIEQTPTGLEPFWNDLEITTPANFTNTTNTTINISWFANSSKGWKYYEVYLNGGLIDNLTAGLVNGTYNYSNSTFTEGEKKFTVDGHDTGGNLNRTSINITIDRTGPYNHSLITPYDGDHTNDNTTFFNWTQAVDNYTVVSWYMINISNASGVIQSLNTTATNITLTAPLIDGGYNWTVTAYDALNNSGTSAPSALVIDTIFPDWTLGDVPKSDNSTNITDPANTTALDCSVNDANLYRINITVTNYTGALIYNHYEPDWNASTWSCGTAPPLDYTNVTNGENLTVELSATDDHTHGDLKGLLYQIDTDGITFFKGPASKKIYFGYYEPGNGFQFLNPALIENYNISASVKNTGNGEYKFNLSFKMPAQNIRFGFAIPKENVFLVNEETGHLIFKDWYIDFNDVLGTVGELNHYENENYHAFYTSTAALNNSKGGALQVGDMATIDPVIGGLNTRTETYIINIFRVTPAIPPGVLSMQYITALVGELPGVFGGVADLVTAVARLVVIFLAVGFVLAVFSALAVAIIEKMRGGF